MASSKYERDPRFENGQENQDGSSEGDATLARILAMYGAKDIVPIFRDSGNRWAFAYFWGALQHSIRNHNGDYRVVDLGAATGSMFPYLAEKWKNKRSRDPGKLLYTGVEIQPKFTEIAPQVFAAQKATASVAEGRIIQANFKDLSHPQLAELKGQADAVAAIAASDGETSFYRHLQTMLAYVKDGGQVFSLDYYDGNLNMAEIHKIRKIFRFIPGMADSSHEVVSKVATSLAQPALEYGKLQSSNFKELAKVFGVLTSDWVKELYNVKAIPSLMKLIASDDFINFDRTIGRPKLPDIIEFAESLGSEVKLGQLESGPFNPTLMAFQATPEIRALVESKAT